MDITGPARQLNEASVASYDLNVVASRCHCCRTPGAVHLQNRSVAIGGPVAATFMSPKSCMVPIQDICPLLGVA